MAVVVFQAGESLQADVQRLQCAAAVALAAKIDHLLARLHDLVGIGEFALVIFQLFQLALLQAQVVQFLQLVGSQLKSRGVIVTGLACPAQGLLGGQVTVQLHPTKTGSYSPFGLENIEFMVSANPGQPPKPLAKVASGGELSRISLGIQVVTAQTSRVPTLVFDEVDVGIGGPTAEIVGQLLRQLGERGQVLTVTHLPQVAAQGHQHLFVRKERSKDSTRTCIDQLDESGRVKEVARMLGGVDMTDESLAHALKLLTTARA